MTKNCLILINTSVLKMVRIIIICAVWRNSYDLAKALLDVTAEEIPWQKISLIHSFPDNIILSVPSARHFRELTCSTLKTNPSPAGGNRAKGSANVCELYLICSYIHTGHKVTDNSCVRTLQLLGQGDLLNKNFNFTIQYYNNNIKLYRAGKIE